MEQCLTFSSAIFDKPEWEGDVLKKPAGWEHATLIRSHLVASFPLFREPWNEEDYAWEFQVRAGRTVVSVLVGELPPGWRVYVIPVDPFGFLRRKRVRAAVEVVADSIERFLALDPRFDNVERIRDRHRIRNL